MAKWKLGEYCDRCQNTGEVDCHCGGDLCVCGRQEIPCPRCHGASAEPYDYDDDVPGEPLSPDHTTKESS